jgi:hypothetical protein
MKASSSSAPKDREKSSLEKTPEDRGTIRRRLSLLGEGETGSPRRRLRARMRSGATFDWVASIAEVKEGITSVGVIEGRTSSENGFGEGDLP